MKITISVDCTNTFEASLVIEALKGMRSLELDTYMAGKTIDNKFSAPPRASEPSETPVAAPAEVERKNVSPGEPSIGKIGSTTKESLLEVLGEGSQPIDKWNEHLKLLWKRGEVKFDGELFYL